MKVHLVFYWRQVGDADFVMAFGAKRRAEAFIASRDDPHNYYIESTVLY